MLANEHEVSGGVSVRKVVTLANAPLSAGFFQYIFPFREQGGGTF